MSEFIFLRKREEVLPLVAKANEEADQEKKALGFLSPQAYLAAAYSEKIIIAVCQDSNEYAGHVFYGGVFPNARVFQTLVKLQFRGKGLASLLLQKLIMHLESLSFSTISAKVATDLEAANQLYESLGFKTIRTIQGGKTTGRRINIRGRVLNSPSLFTWASEPQIIDHLSLPIQTSLKAPLYLMDLNIIFDAVQKRANSDAAKVLFRAGFQNLVRIAVSEELIEELERTSRDKNADPLLGFAKNFWRLSKPNTANLRNFIKILAPILFPDRLRENKLTTQDKSDIAHLATAIENRLAGFITGEKAILAASDFLRAEFHIEVLSPYELKELIDDTSDKIPDFSEARPTLHLSIHPINFLNNSQELKIAIKMLKVPDAALPSSEMIRSGELRSVVIKNDKGNCIAYAWWTIHSGPIPTNDAYICVDENTPQVESVLDSICDRIFRDSSHRDISLIRLKAQLHTPLAQQTIEDNGFKYTDASDPIGRIYQKICVGNVIHPHNWQKTRLKISNLTHGFLLPKMMPEVDEQKNLIKVKGNKGNELVIDYKIFEQLVSPALIASSCIEGVIVPIMKAYADDLFGGKSKQLTMLDAPDAVLRRERVYFCSPSARNSLRPGRTLFFYESKGKGGSGAIIAAARITQTNVVHIDDMHENLLQRGVIDLKMLKKAAPSGQRAVTFFNNILLFKRPVSFEKLGRLGCNNRSNFVTATEISATQAQEILFEGLINE